MRSRFILLPLALSVLAALAVACGRSEPPAAVADAPAPATASPKQASATGIKPLDKKKFGAPITDGTSTMLADIAKEPSKFASKSVLTEGYVKAVCQERGCWMEIQDDATGLVHIKMAGHAFGVPRESSGHRARIQGTVLAPVGGKDHCAEEAAEATGQVAKVQIEATGVEFVD
jgi:hypothetical protein